MCVCVCVCVSHTLRGYGAVSSLEIGVSVVHPSGKGWKPKRQNLGNKILVSHLGIKGHLRCKGGRVNTTKTLWR